MKFRVGGIFSSTFDLRFLKSLMCWLGVFFPQLDGKESPGFAGKVHRDPLRLPGEGGQNHLINRLFWVLVIGGTLR